MPKSAVADWSTTAANNTDIGGINIAENCPAAGMNNALRENMAQIATWRDTVGARNIPSNSETSAYVLALADVGYCVDITTGGVTVPANATVAFTVGDTVSIYNNSASNQTITQAVGVTLRWAGTASTGNRTLAQRGWVAVRKIATDEWVISGAGLS